MHSEIVGSSGERSTVNEAVGGFSVFLASRISHSICASQVSSYVLRLVIGTFSLSLLFFDILAKNEKKTPQFSRGDFNP
jgi:hypothetical protein